jgi:hypothetical protein
MKKDVIKNHISELKIKFVKAEADEQREIMDELNNCYEMLKKESEIAEHEDRIHKDTIVQSLTGLASILLVLNYEKKDILTSKAFGIAQKMIGR